MRVAIESSAVFGVPCGLRTYTVELARRMAALSPGDEFQAYAARWAPFPESPWPGERPRNLSLALHRAPFSPLMRLEHGLGLPVQEPLYLGGVDLFHGAGQFLPRLRRTRSLLTLHHWHDMRHHSGSWKDFYFGRVYEQSIRWADRIVTVSEFTKGYLLEHFPIAPERVSVVYHGIFDPLPSPTAEEAAALRRRRGLPERFVMCLSRLNPGKNIVRLVKAFARLAPRHEGLGLALVGHADEDYLPLIHAAVAESRLEGRVFLTGPVTDAEVPLFYAACEAFVFPSTSEGFGIPLIEAMAMGRPVAGARATSIPEVVGDAGLLFDPLDEEAMADAVEGLLVGAPRRDELVAKGRARAAGFSWEAAARRTLEIYKELA